MEEVYQFERKILSAFNGRFCTYANANRFPLPCEVFIALSVNLDPGSLELIFEEVGSMGWDKESLFIKAGERIKLGKLGTKHFMLPDLAGREVFIYDFWIDSEKMELTLLGSWSPIVKDCYTDNYSLMISLCRYPDGDKSAALRIGTILCNESEESIMLPLFREIIYWSFFQVNPNLNET